MGYCHTCGTALAPEMAFCGHCGAKRLPTSAPPPSSVPYPGQPGTRVSTARKIVLSLCGLVALMLIIVGMAGGREPSSSSSGASAGPSKSTQRADLRRIYSVLMGAIQDCDTASQTAATDLQTLAQSGDTLTAYQDAKAAHDSCDAAASTINLISSPDSLSSDDWHLRDVQNDFVRASDARRDAWGNVENVLQNPNDLASTSNALDEVKTATKGADLGTLWLAEDAISLTVKLADVTPVPPTPQQ